MFGAMTTYIDDPPVTDVKINVTVSHFYDGDQEILTEVLERACILLSRMLLGAEMGGPDVPVGYHLEGEGGAQTVEVYSEPPDAPHTTRILRFIPRPVDIPTCGIPGGSRGRQE